MRMAKRLWKNTQSEHYHERYRAARNQYFRDIRSAKERCWRRFLSSARGADIFTAYRYMKPTRHQATPPLIDPNDMTGTARVSFEQKADLFRQALFPRPPASDFTPIISRRRELKWVPFTPMEIREAIFTSAPQKSPGPDGLPFRCLQKAYTAIPDYFHGLYIALGTTGYHPICWREATTVIIPKPGKPDYSVPKAYRPIALLNCLGKTLEKLMATRLSYYAEKHGLLHCDQFGGRKQRSSIDAAMSLAHEIDKAMNSKQTYSVLFMDVKGAFDNVSKHRPLTTMQELGVPAVVRNWTSHFLSQRSTALTFDGLKDEQRAVLTGIPQGSPASPILFLLYIRPLFDAINSRHGAAIWMPSYIDDVALCVSGPTRVANARLLEDAAQTAFSWAASNAVLFDDSKTEMLHFDRKRKNDYEPQESVTLPNGTVVPPGTKGVAPDVVRWIGIWFDRKLTFRHHVTVKAASGKRAMGMLQRMANTEAGLSPAAVRQLYVSCILPVMTYGAEIWYHKQRTLYQKLETVQNDALRKILGAFRTTPIGAMQNDAALPPMDVRLEHMVRKYAIRTLSLPRSHPIRRRCPRTLPTPEEEEYKEEEDFVEWDGDEDEMWLEEQDMGEYEEDEEEEETEMQNWCPWDEPPRYRRRQYRTRLHRTLSHLRQWVCEGDPIETRSSTAAAPWETTAVITHISTRSKEDEAKHHTALIKKLDHVRNKIAYTDGSRLEDGRVGAGISIDGVEMKEHLGKYAEVYDAELTGIRKAAEYYKDWAAAHPRKRRMKLWIFTDNQAAIQRLTSLRPGPGQTTAITVARISRQLAKRELSLWVQWVPGHTAVDGNEKADGLAKEAARKRPRNFTPTLTMSFLKRAARAEMVREWQHTWESRHKGTNYSGLFKKKPDQFFFTGNRKLISAITQLRTGHGYFNSYLHGIPSAEVASPLCSCRAGEHQTARHLILSCLHSREERKELNRSFGRRQKLRLQPLLYAKNGFKPLQDYLTATGIATREWRLRHLNRDTDSHPARGQYYGDWEGVGEDQEEEVAESEE
jgi:ribonuclease HI